MCTKMCYRCAPMSHINFLLNNDIVPRSILLSNIAWITLFIHFPWLLASKFPISQVYIFDLEWCGSYTPHNFNSMILSVFSFLSFLQTIEEISHPWEFWQSKCLRQKPRHFVTDKLFGLWRWWAKGPLLVVASCGHESAEVILKLATLC